MGVVWISGRKLDRTFGIRLGIWLDIRFPAEYNHTGFRSATLQCSCSFVGLISVESVFRIDRIRPPIKEKLDPDPTTKKILYWIRIQALKKWIRIRNPAIFMHTNSDSDPQPKIRAGFERQHNLGLDESLKKRIRIRNPPIFIKTDADSQPSKKSKSGSNVS